MPDTDTVPAAAVVAAAAAVAVVAAASHTAAAGTPWALAAEALSACAMAAGTHTRYTRAVPEGARAGRTLAFAAGVGAEAGCTVVKVEAGCTVVQAEAARKCTKIAVEAEVGARVHWVGQEASTRHTARESWNRKCPGMRTGRVGERMAVGMETALV